MILRLFISAPEIMRTELGDLLILFKKQKLNLKK